MNEVERKTLLISFSIGGAALMVYLAAKELAKHLRVAPLPTDPHPHNIPGIDRKLHVIGQVDAKRDASDDPTTMAVKFENPFVKYVHEKGVRTPELQQQLLDETKSLFPTAFAMIGGKQVGALLNNLIRLSGAKRGVEVGTFTGFTTLGMAQALPEDGKLFALDVSDKFARLGQKYWAQAKVDSKIVLKIAPAEQSLNELLADPSNHGAFDFAFVDADKQNYDTYFEKLLILLKKGGWILFDNMFGFGHIVKSDAEIPAEDKTSVAAIRRLNEKLRWDDRVEISLLEVCDGVSLVVKK